MADMLAEITKLNKKIETLMQKKTRAEAQKELLEKRLKEETTAYSTKYGVDLAGDTFVDTKKNVQKELKSVTAKVSKEFALASKVVDAVESGDITTAYSLLGIEPEPDVPTEDLEDTEVEVADEIVGNDSDDTVDFTDEDTLEAEEDSEETEFTFKDSDDDDMSNTFNFAGVDLSVEEDDTGDLEDGFYAGSDDDDDDDFGFGEVLNAGKYK